MTAMFPTSSNETHTARELCAICPVRDVCLQWALDNGEKFGIWGGTSERQRRALRRGGVAARPRNALVAAHGTRSGYNAHRLRGEQPCDMCREGNNAAVRDARRLAHQQREVAS